MAILNDDIKNQVREVLADLSAPVKLVVFTQGEGGALECAMCAETRELVEEVAALSDKVSVEVRDFVKDSEVAETYGIDKIPAIAVVREGDEPADYGIRLYGIPSGYEFGTLIEDIRLASSGDPELSEATLKQLAELKQPVNIQVFVTPTCPYCPRAVLLAHRLAMASEHVTAAMVEATEFPHLANRYQVYGVPRTVVNDVIHVEGAVPESMLMTKLMSLTDDAFMKQARARWEAMVN
ncbi:MAG: glutaredoxin [Chloroflexota bacterium]|nr:thioredoxin family protein [Caldilinea sp.]GIK71335.1 MAG: glutaredoxin [Chloroflexota bacterium]